MRDLDLRGMRQAAGAACLSLLLACGADMYRPDTAPDTAVVASVRLRLADTIEPEESAFAVMLMVDTQNRSVNYRQASWRSSDSDVASVTEGTVIGHRPGDATITATVDGVSGSAVIHVSWRPETRLIIGNSHITVQVGDVLTFAPKARGVIAPGNVSWTNSNPLVARMDVPGALVTLVPGSTTVVARYLGLVDSVIVDAVNMPIGFGYFYSGDAAVSDYYDETVWTAPAGKGFSTGVGPVMAHWEAPYPSYPDVGWTGPSTPARDALLYVVSLENASCAAYLQPNTAQMPGVPLVDCRDPFAVPSMYWESVRMEFVAFRPGEFSGTLALVRPGWSPFSTTGFGITETAPTPDSRAYAMPGVARDSLFWFVTPGSSSVAGCAMAPATAVPPQLVASVICNNAPRFQPAPAPVFYAVAFGSDTRRGTAPIGFAEVGSTGQAVRKVVSDLDISTKGASAQALDVVVSGARLASFDRIPAVLVTAIAPVAATCGISEPVREAPTTVTFTVTCPAGVSGVMLGVVY